VQYNHDRLIIVKRRSEKYSLQLATERRQRRCIPDRRWQAVHARAEATGKARSPSVEHLIGHVRRNYQRQSLLIVFQYFIDKF